MSGSCALAARAALELGRLEQTLTGDGAAGRWEPGFLRRSALDLAACEGWRIGATDAVRLICDPAATAPEPGARVAADLHAAAAHVLAARFPDSALIEEAMRLADLSTPLRGRREEALRGDAETAAGLVAAGLGERTPEGAAEALRLLWSSRAFERRAARAARLLAPLCVRLGFGCERAAANPAHRLSEELRAAPDLLGDRQVWLDAFLAACAAAAAAERHAAGEAERLHASLLAAARPERSSSSLGAALMVLHRRPVLGIRDLADELGLTFRGAQIVLERLAEAGAVAREGGARNRRYLCRAVLRLDEAVRHRQRAAAAPAGEEDA